jgi:lipopolysaccharide transport system ATP-binding protein
MTDAMIRVEGLGKKYRIHHEAAPRYTALRDVIADRVKGMARVGRSRAGRPYDEEFWALRDLSFHVKQGEVVGVIGRNGAGKSTLLKILSRITEPTTGRIELNGRVSSLLEVGTGFHPELTGRENIFLNGSILGMSRREVARKFDEIVAFAEVDRFLDTPVKRYSSGMYMRLAFAVAAHMEPEILIVDEVLAVGDAEFQKKCLGRMGEVSREGRTVLFVSHNLGALTSICESGLLLEQGRMVAHGEVGSVVERYRMGIQSQSVVLGKRSLEGTLRSISIEEILVNGEPLSGRQCVTPRQPVSIVLRGVCADRLPNVRLGLNLSFDGVRLLTLHDGPAALDQGPFETTFTLPAGFLRPGEYWLALGGHQPNSGEWFYARDVACIEMMAHWGDDYAEDNLGLVNLVGAARRTEFEPQALHAKA